MSQESESATWFRLDADWREQMRARAAENARRAERAKRERAAERESTSRVELTLDALIDAIGARVDGGNGWDGGKREAYAHHLIQPYCTCEVESGWGCDPGRWMLCNHAVDEGF